MAQEVREMLNDDILEGISGGAANTQEDTCVKDAGAAYEPHYCKKCGKVTDHEVFSGSRIRCSICKTVPTL